MKKTYILIYFIISSNILFAESGAIISGIVMSAKDREPIPGATVILEGTSYGAKTNLNGHYKIKNVPAGNYSVLASSVGYKTGAKDIVIENHPRYSVNFRLDENIFKTGEVIVSANKRIQQVQEVPISVSLIDSRSLSQRNVTKLDDALLYVPGVQISGGHVSIRGSSGFAFGVGSRVAFLLDGFPLLSGDNGDMKYDAMPIFNVERVEIVKGAGSALYGTSALGGVINVITKTPSEKPEFKIKAFSGIYTKPRFDEWEYSDDLNFSSGFDAGYSHKIGGLGLIMSGAYYRDESYREYSDNHRFNYFTKMTFDFNEKTNISLTGNFASEEKADWVYWHSLYKATFPSVGANRDIRITSKKASLTGELKHIIDLDNFIILRTGLFKTNFENTYEISHQDYRASDASSYNTELQFSSRLFQKLLLTYGTNFIYNDVEAIIYGDVNSQSIISAYSQAEISDLFNMTINAGARLDYEKMTEVEENLEFSPKIGLSYKAPYNIVCRASLGKGFRAPMVAERHAAIQYDGIDVEPNLDLDPERSWSYEIGFNQKGIEPFFGSMFEFDFSIFQNDLYDLIEPTIMKVDNKQFIQFRNITRARIRGMDISIRAMLFGAIGLETGLTAMEPLEQVEKTNATGDVISKDFSRTLKYRSKFLWYTSLFVPIGNFEFQADYRYLSRVENIDETLSVLGISDYDSRVPVHVVDARLIYHLKKENKSIPLDITLNAKNLFDYYYVHSPANLAPTRFISLQVEASF